MLKRTCRMYGESLRGREFVIRLLSLVPKAGLYQRGLLKSLKTWAIPALIAANEWMGICFYLSPFVPFFLGWACRLTPI